MQQSYDALYHGLLYSLMSWKQLDEFWARIDRGAGWHLYAVGEVPPETPSPAETIDRFIRAIDALLKKEHRESYCGIVYADDIQAPSLIKIYDPGHLGSGCGTGKNPPLPGWIMSRQRPSELQPKFVPENRKRWWREFCA
jgi:hypothetical protein